MTDFDGTLAGDLYNALTEQQVHIPRVNYYTDGSWCLVLAARGGLIRGVPVIRFDPGSRMIHVQLRRLLTKRHVASISLGENTDYNAVIMRICELVVPMTR